MGIATFSRRHTSFVTKAVKWLTVFVVLDVKIILAEQLWLREIPTLSSKNLALLLFC